MVNSSIIIAPHILLPRPGIDLTKFAVIACDQFTSQLEYWKQLEATIKDAPSALRLIFPEAYLPVVNHDEYIHNINQNIDRYLADGLLTDIGEGFILVERSTPFKMRRLGLMMALDLEQYSYIPGNKAPIRASEATIVERIPPRLKIREHAGIELPHVLVLFDDPKRNIIEGLYALKDRFPVVYDFDLNQGGGHLRGYFIKETNAIMASFYKLMGDKSLLFMVGDGNHSLATAKAHWDKIKQGLSEAERNNHPARYSLVEAMNIYDEGLDFEPIHRLVMHVGPDFLTGLQAIAHGPKDGYGFHSALKKFHLGFPKSSPEAYRLVQDYIDGYIKAHPGAEVDYVHGEEDAINLANKHSDAAAIIMPALTKQDIFEYLERGVVLPRKAFSMGHAIEKRYYLESKLIK